MLGTHSIMQEIVSFIRACGGAFRDWYVGVAADPRDRLFVDHSVREKFDVWIIRDAGSDSLARQTERHLLALGCQGGGGGGSCASRFVYAYRITLTTRE